MYGKKFIAALLFLAVADVEVNAYGHYGGYGGYGGYGEEEETEPMFDPAPAPEAYHADEDGTVVDFPSDFDGWDFYRAVFHLHENDMDMTDFIDNLPEEYADYAPTGYVMKGEIYHDPAGTELQFGIGLAHESWEEGMLATYDKENADLPFETYLFQVDNMLAGDFTAPATWVDDPATTDPMGHGASWGQEMFVDDDGNDVWCIHSYNDNTSDENWESGMYHFVYLEMTYAADYFTGFEQDIDIYAISAGAHQLIAATTTATLLLASM